MDEQRRRLLEWGVRAPLAALAMQVAPAAAGTGAAAEGGMASSDGVQPAGASDGRRDFDFYHGRWHVENRRLKERLAGSDEWIEFEAIDKCRPILDGLGSLDRYSTQWNGGIVGMALRLYRPQTRQWHVYWASDRDGVLEPPLIGGFRDGVGTFEGVELHHGKPLPSRAVWSEIRHDRLRWEQALSGDGGRTWETNWVMHMTRLA